MHIYGSYVTEKAMQLHNQKDGFLVKGRAENAQEMIKNAKVLLAPIRFGAGIKGKLTDAMQCGTPSVTTTIGAEGMIEIASNLAMTKWSGKITDNPNDFAIAAIELFSDENLWKMAQKNGIEIINNRYNATAFGKLFIDKIMATQNSLENHRTHNFIGEMLQMQTLKSTKYMSKWIEEKNKS